MTGNELASWDLTPNIIKSIQLYKFAPATNYRPSRGDPIKLITENTDAALQLRKGSKSRETRKDSHPQTKSALRNSCWWCGCTIASKGLTKIAFIAFTLRVTSTLLLVARFLWTRVEGRSCSDIASSFGGIKQTDKQFELDGCLCTECQIGIKIIRSFLFQNYSDKLCF